jgi:hypothetical protein
MRLTLEECRRRFPNHPQPAPIEYAGQWVAWDGKRKNILANGANFSDVCEAVRKAGHEHAIFQRVIGTAFVGGGG